MKLENRKSIVIGVIALLELFINIFNSVNTAEGSLVMAVICGTTLALCDMLLLFSVIEIANKPVKGVLLLVLSQTFTFIYELLDGAKLSEAVTDMGLIGVLVIVALVFHSVKAYKNSEAKKFDIRNILNYERVIYKVGISTKVVIYSLAISAAFSIAGSESMELLNGGTVFRLYTAFALIIPSLVVLGIITTSYIAYDIFVAKILLEIYTIYLISSVGKFDVIQIIYIIIEIIALFYAYLITFSKHEKRIVDKSNKENENNETTL